MRISVVIPVYNVEKWLPKCLDSVLSQTFKDFEVLCVDDGSTDGSPLILNEYAKCDARVKVVRQENAGVGSARNRALDMATGDYVVFMDPDDYYPSNDVLEKLYAAVTENGCEIAGGRLRQFTDDGEGNGKSWIGGDAFPRYGVVSYREYQSPYWYYCYIYSRELIERGHLRFPLYRRFQDPPFFINAMLLAEKFYAIEDVVYCWRTSHKKVNWEANDCRLLREHLSGVLEVLRLAQRYGFYKMFVRIVKQSFKLITTFSRKQYCEDELKQIFMLLRDLKQISTFRKISLFRYLFRTQGFWRRVKGCVSSLLAMRNDEKKPLVTVIIPVHNTALYLRQCLDSILVQVLRNIEIICIDDGSTDGSLKILNEYAQKDRRVKVITSNSQGAGIARNKGMSLARGKYLFFCDSDDFLFKWHLSKLYKTAERYNADIVVTPYCIFNEIGKDISRVKIPRYIRKGKVPFSIRDIGEEFLVALRPQVWNKFFRRDFIAKYNCQFMNLPRSNDIYFSYFLCAVANRIVPEKKIGYAYRIGHSGNLQSNNDASPFTVIEAYNAIYCKFKELRFEGVYLDALNKAFKSSCNYMMLRLKEVKNIEEFKKQQEKMVKIWHIKNS